MLSNTCKYGIRAVIYLAVNQGDGSMIGIKKIAKDLDLPSPFLGKILQDLVKKKLLNSTKGPNGGFSLAKKPEDVSLYDVVSAIDGTDVFETCLIGLKVCEGNHSKEANCPFYSRSEIVKRSMYKAFEEQTIKHFVDGLKSPDDIMKF